MNDIIENCNVTRGRTRIIKKYNISNKSIHTGVDITADTVYNYISGVVLYVGQTNKCYTVAVQYNYNICFTYSNLKDVYVRPGELVPSGVEIGKCDKFVHFECAKSDSSNKQFPVRYGTQTYYKVDSTDYLYNGKLLQDPNSTYEVN